MRRPGQWGARARRRRAERRERSFFRRLAIEDVADFWRDPFCPARRRGRRRWERRTLENTARQKGVAVPPGMFTRELRTLVGVA